VSSVCFSPDSNFIVSGSEDKTVRVWDWKKQREIKQLKGHTGWVNSVCVSPDGNFIVSGSDDKIIRVWYFDLENPHKAQKSIILINTEEEINSCAFSNDNSQIVAGGRSGQILMYDIENLPVGTAIVTALRDLDNNLSVRCSYCAKIFDIREDKLGNIVKCPHCEEELQLNNFTTNPIIIEDESIGVETNNLVSSVESIVNNDSIQKETKKDFFGKLFGR